MATQLTVDQIIRLAERLSPRQRAKIIAQLTPKTETVKPSASNGTSLDDKYQRGYERIPEDAAEAQAMLSHLPLAPERWE